MKRYFSFKHLVRIDKKVFPIFSVLILAFLLVLFIWRYYKAKPIYEAQLINSQVTKLEQVLRDIDDSCSILSVQHDRTPIDFLTVEKFVGSEIGGLNLAYPKYWAGAYVHDNFSMRGVSYELIKAKDGYFIVPGNGLRLPNGLVMGDDIIITKKVAVMPFLEPRGLLNFHNIALGKKVSFMIGDWPYPKNKQKKVKEINRSLIEFDRAMSYTMVS